LTIYKQANTQK